NRTAQLVAYVVEACCRIEERSVNRIFDQRRLRLVAGPDVFVTDGLRQLRRVAQRVVVQGVEFGNRSGQLRLVVGVPVGVVRGIRNHQMLRVSGLVDIGKIFLHYGPSPSNKVFVARVEIVFIKGGYKVDRVRQGVVISAGHCVTRRQTGPQLWG